MIFAELILTEQEYELLDTEIKFNIASAKADSAELLAFSYPKLEDSPEEEKRIARSILKVLRGLKKNGVIQFFLTEDSIEKRTTEAQYIENKYKKYLISSTSFKHIYVKI